MSMASTNCSAVCSISSFVFFVAFSRSSRFRGAQGIRIKEQFSPWPVKRQANWTARVVAPSATKELERARVSIERGRPHGEEKSGCGKR